MFDSRKSLSNRLADRADLLIDFATLGEYGLEPAGRTTRACEADQAPRTRQSRRHGAPTTFSTVRPDSPYADILHGPRGRYGAIQRQLQPA